MMSSIKALSFAILALAGLIDQTIAADNITSDAVFYGQSPPVYPSREYILERPSKALMKSLISYPTL